MDVNSEAEYLLDDNNNPTARRHETGHTRRTVGRRELKRVVLASVVGSFVEWFEFSVYGYLAAVMGRVFFPASAPGLPLLSW